MESMEALQLIVNVIVITAVTALTLTWYLKKRDDQKLTVEHTLRRQPDRHEPTTPIRSSTMDHRRDCLKEKLSAPGSLQVVPTPAIAQDIRQFVAHRAREWANLSVATTTSPGR